MYIPKLDYNMLSRCTINQHRGRTKAINLTYFGETRFDSIKNIRGAPRTLMIDFMKIN